MSAYRFLDWNNLKHSLGDWHRQIRLSAELTNLDDRMLRDIGVARHGTRFESSKLFWTPWLQ